MAGNGSESGAIGQAILWLALIDVLIGAVLALGGELLWDRPDLAWVGTGLVVAGGLLYGLMRVLGHRPGGPR